MMFGIEQLITFILFANYFWQSGTSFQNIL